jgi:hypothetical protein
MAFAVKMEAARYETLSRGDPIMATAQSPEAGKASVFEDFIDIFTSPAEVFQRRMGAGIWIPLLVIVAVTTALFFALRGPMQPAFDAEFARGAARAMAKNPQITAEMMEKQRSMIEKFSFLFVVIGIPISVALTGLVLWLVGKIFNSTMTVGDGMMVATYAFLPRVISSVATGVIALMTDPSNMKGMYSATVSAGHFLDPDTASHMAVAFAGRVDLFIIWQTILLAIGLSVAGKIPRSQAYIAAALVWVIGALPGLAGGG